MAAYPLINVAQEGYDTEPGAHACPYYTSSPSGMAWLAGQWLKINGRPRPTKAAMSRGYRVRVDDTLLDINSPKAIKELKP